MPVVLNANYRIWKANKKQTVPAPVDPDTPNALWWYDRIARDAPSFGRDGFSAVLFPPSAKTQGGHANDADGYGLYDPYDIGSKNQSYSIETRFGRARQLRRAVACLHACGLQAYGDVVLHQYDGGRNGTYEYLGADGKTKTGRYGKQLSSFVGNPPRVPVDPVWDMEGNFAFGDMASYVNSMPKGYMADGAIQNGDWLLRTVGLDGMRIDDTKGMNLDFVRRYATSYAMARAFKFGELFDGNPDTLNSWVNQMDGSCSTIDFTVHWHLQNVCDNNGNASDLLSNGCAFFKRNPLKAMSYAESPDTDVAQGQSIINNKGLAYWYLLTSEGYPLAYFRDWSNDPYCYGLSKVINNLIWVHEHLASGTTIPRYGDSRVACFERTGYPGLLSAANWDTWNRRTITVQTNFPPNTRLHDYSGHIEDVWTDWQSKVTFTIPSNAYSKGQSFVCLSLPGQDKQFELSRHYTTQEFFGASDLDTPPATPGLVITAGEIWCDGGYDLELDHKMDATDLTTVVLDPDGKALPMNGLKTKTHTRGWHKIQVASDADAPKKFVLSAHYMGTQGITQAEAEADLPKNNPSFKSVSIPESVSERNQALLRARLVKRFGEFEEAQSDPIS